jgi:hypothetical protein
MTHPLNALRRTLLGYLRLPDDWDGYGGRPARARAIVDAFLFLDVLPEDLRMPAPMLAGSGVVGLYWDGGAHYASVEFTGDGSYSFLTDSGHSYGGGEGLPANRLAAELAQYLRSSFCRARRAGRFSPVCRAQTTRRAC